MEVTPPFHDRSPVSFDQVTVFAYNNVQIHYELNTFQGVHSTVG